MLHSARRGLAVVVASLPATVLACGSKTPSAPTPPPTTTPAVTVTSITVGVPGNTPATLAPGDKLQLFAQAVSSDGSTADVTNLAVWQSSNPVVATVTPSGVLTAAALGALDVNATYKNRIGSLHAEVQKPGCRATLSPESLVFGAIATSGSVSVTMTRSDCRWTASSDAAWLSFRFDPGQSGSGGFSYNVPGNNNTDPRDANIVVNVVDGPAAVHKVHQERPVSCVYKVSPERASFSASGGAGSFQVTTVPGDCKWTVRDSLVFVGVKLTGATSGTGAGTVTYSIAPNSTGFDRDGTYEITGLSGVNPPGLHRIHISR